MLPHNTASQIVKTTSHILEWSINIRSKEALLASGVDLSIPALIMPNKSAWANTYSHDLCCATIIKMILNPSNITTAEVAKVHAVCQGPIQQSQMK
jgi:hypothetical protein